jgi:hypothetical protein
VVSTNLSLFLWRVSIAPGELSQLQKEKIAIRRPMKSALPVQKDGPRINEEIRVREVQLIDASGHNHGPTPIQAALDMAQAAGLDLVEIAPNSSPPVCKVLDYGKYKFQAQKKSSGGPQEAESRRGQGDQTPADDRRPRLRREDALHAALFRRGRQGEGHAAVPRA